MRSLLTVAFMLFAVVLVSGNALAESKPECCDKPVLRVFCSATCPPCDHLKDQIKRIDLKDVEVCCYNVEDREDGDNWFACHQVEKWPTMILYSKSGDGKFYEVKRFVGSKVDVRKWVTESLTANKLSANADCPCGIKGECGTQNCPQGCAGGAGCQASRATVTVRQSFSFRSVERTRLFQPGGFSIRQSAGSCPNCK